MIDDIFKIAAIKGVVNLIEEEAKKEPPMINLHKEAVEFIYGICITDKVDLPAEE